jgi:Thioesterase superfamily
VRDEPASPHEHLAAATRRLVDAVLRADLGDDELSAAAETTDELVDRLERRGAGTMSDTERWRHRFSVNPVAPAFSYERTAHGVVGRGEFGLAAEGPPGCVHGGWVALAFDEALGIANNAAGHLTMTGRLTVRYRRPTPLHTEITLEAHVARVDGRRVTTVGTMRVGENVTAEAEALFVAPRP